MTRGALSCALALVAALAACGGAPSSQVRESRVSGNAGGIPIATDLHRATGLPSGSVYSVARGPEGWRVLYKGGAGSDAGVAARLCGLEGKAAAGISPERIASAGQLPGARKILITCRG